MADTNYTSGDDYIVEFLGYRFTFNTCDFEQRVVAAASKLGLVEANELDEDETNDLVALAAQGLIDEPESRLGRYLAAQLGARLARRRRVARLLAAQARVPGRLARPPGEARRPRGRLGRDARPSSPTSIPAAAGRCSSSRPCRRGTSSSSAADSAAGLSSSAKRSEAEPARRDRIRPGRPDRYIAACSRSTTSPPTPSSSRSASLTWGVLIAARRAALDDPQGAGDRRRLLRDGRRADRLDHLGRLPLPAAQPAALRPAGARARLPDRARDRRRARAGTRGRSSSPRRRSRRPGASSASSSCPRRDVAGALGVPLLLLFLWRSRSRAVYASVFLVVAGLELYGTAIGTWRWAKTLPGLGIPDGNPPSGVASGYVWFDVMALLIAPAIARALTIRARRSRLRSEQPRPRSTPA